MTVCHVNVEGATRELSHSDEAKGEVMHSYCSFYPAHHLVNFIVVFVKHDNYYVTGQPMIDQYYIIIILHPRT